MRVANQGLRSFGRFAKADVILDLTVRRRLRQSEGIRFRSTSQSESLEKTTSMGMARSSPMSLHQHIYLLSSFLPFLSSSSPLYFVSNLKKAKAIRITALCTTKMFGLPLVLLLPTLSCEGRSLFRQAIPRATRRCLSQRLIK